MSQLQPIVTWLPLRLFLQFKGIIKITAVNCNAQKKICDEYGIKDFPTLKVVFHLAYSPQNAHPHARMLPRSQMRVKMLIAATLRIEIGAAGNKEE
jgi:hypothetical protein